MMRVLLTCLMALPTLAQSEPGLRQFQTETATPSENVIARLALRLPETVELTRNESAALIAYNGLATPPALLRFLAATFPVLDTSALAPGHPAVIAVTITATDAGAQISAVINADFPPYQTAVTLPDAASVLMTTGGDTDCASQTILSHPATVSDTAATYRSLLQQQGFRPLENTDGDMSFFVGHAHGCTVVAYFQPDPDADDQTVVVLRFVED